MLKNVKKLGAFAFSITEKGKKPYMMYAPKYYFDPIEQVIQLQNDNGNEIGVIDIRKEKILKVDIYDKTNLAHNYVQTILSGRDAV